MTLSKAQKAEIARTNGAKSRGPKTPQGKAISSRNALRHGLTSNGILLSGIEDEAEYMRLKTGIRRHYQPQSVMESLWVDRLITCLWRARRVAFEEKQMADADNSSSVDNRSFHLTKITERLETLSLYEERIMRQVHAAIKEIERLKEKSATKQPPLEIASRIRITKTDQ